MAVVGGGPAGSATALALLGHGLTVAVVEAGPARAERVGETVPPEVYEPLSRLGAWDGFAADGHLPTGGTASAWGDAGLRWRDGFTHPLGGGWHLDRARFDATLAALAGRRGAALVKGRAGPLRRHADRWSIAVRGGQRVAARFVVDAGGRAATVARRCGAERVVVDRQVAVFAVLPVPPAEGTPHHVHTLVEATAGGWWYAARIPGDRAVAAFFSDADLVRGPASRPGGWHAALLGTDHVAAFLGEPPPPPSVTVTAAGSSCLAVPCGPGWAATGDAATAWDPLASAGVVHALRSGIEVADAVAAAMDGDRSALPAYARRVQGRFTRFLVERRQRYLGEARWPDAPFWRRRGGALRSAGTAAATTTAGRPPAPRPPT